MVKIVNLDSKHKKTLLHHIQETKLHVRVQTWVQNEVYNRVLWISVFLDPDPNLNPPFGATTIIMSNSVDNCLEIHYVISFYLEHFSIYIINQA